MFAILIKISLHTNAAPLIEHVFGSCSMEKIFRLIMQNNSKKKQRSFLNLASRIDAIAIQATGNNFRGEMAQYTVYFPRHCSASVVILMRL